jgi:hypothetical protein
VFHSWTGNQAISVPIPPLELACIAVWVDPSEKASDIVKDWSEFVNVRGMRRSRNRVMKMGNGTNYSIERIVPCNNP